MVLDLFCGGGGSSEGIRRASARPIGLDSSDQPSYTARFGIKSFLRGDALDVVAVRDLVRRCDPCLILASPPCEGYSTVTAGGTPSRAPRLIAETRVVLETLGVPFIIENVSMHL